MSLTNRHNQYCGGPNHCEYDIWAPDHRSSMNNLAFSAYAYTMQTIEDFINDLAAEEDPSDVWVQERLAVSHGINLDHLTTYEISYIEREVANRHNKW